MTTLKPQSNRPLYSNTVIGTLAVDGWDVTFGTAGGACRASCSPAQSPLRCTKCKTPRVNGQCTNFISFDVAIQLPLHSKGLNTAAQLSDEPMFADDYDDFYRGRCGCIQYTVKRNSDGGFGFSINGDGRGNCVRICRVDGLSHAWQVGLEVGDELLKVDSTSVGRLPVNSVAAIIRFAANNLSHLVLS